MGCVLAVAEQRENKLKKICYEVVSEGKRLAEKLGLEMKCALIGGSVAGLADEIAQYGAKDVLITEGREFDKYASMPYTSALYEIVKKTNAGIILLGATGMGRDLGARLSARLKAGFVNDCTGIEVGSNKDITFLHPMFG
ncbi:MAG: electron transfer flavoprotein subunit alpha, partial [Nitrospirae bacterium]|nr:electron transfer flavoprotein subunit alpha [Nitrospirota bacterium]